MIHTEIFYDLTSFVNLRNTLMWFLSYLEWHFYFFYSLFFPGDLNIFPDSSQNFSKILEDEANSYFQKIYNQPPHQVLSIDEVLEMLKRFRDSTNKRERVKYFKNLQNFLTSPLSKNVWLILILTLLCLVCGEGTHLQILL